MRTVEFMERLGLPEAEAGWDGVLSRSAPSGEFETTTATAILNDGKVTLSVEVSDLEGSETLLEAEGSEDAGGELRITAARGGNPPEDMPAVDAVDLFMFMAGGLGKARFTPSGRSRGPSAGR